MNLPTSVPTARYTVVSPTTSSQKSIAVTGASVVMVALHINPPSESRPQIFTLLSRPAVANTGDVVPGEEEEDDDDNDDEIGAHAASRIILVWPFGLLSARA